jgi:DNA-binding NarL/FixJ family response regulator
MKIKIAIYEDHHDLRANLKILLESQSDFEVVGTYANCLNIMENCKSAMPDVIVMDIDMPEMGGIEGVTLVKAHYPNIEIMMHTVFEDDVNIFNAIKAGASAYILKKNSFTDLPFSIRELIAGGSPMSPSIARRVLQQIHTPQKNKDLEGLSERELEILNELAKGLSQKMIASKLSISIETVRTHCKKIYQKLHVHSLSEAIHKLFLNQ